MVKLARTCVPLRGTIGPNPQPTFGRTQLLAIEVLVMAGAAAVAVTLFLWITYAVVRDRLFTNAAKAI
jgi:hypothetical protein